MFQLDPISTSNIIAIIQAIIVVLGFYFSYSTLLTARKSLDAASANLKIAAENSQLAASNAQAQLFNQMIIQGRDLQFRRWPLFVDPPPVDESEKAALKVKQNDFRGLVISYYAACFELREVLQLPSTVGNLLDADIREIMRIKEFRDKLDEVKARNVLSGRFIDYIQRVSGV